MPTGGFKWILNPCVKKTQTLFSNVHLEFNTFSVCTSNVEGMGTSQRKQLKLLCFKLQLLPSLSSLESPSWWDLWVQHLSKENMLHSVSSSWDHRRHWVTHWLILSYKTRISRVIQLDSIKADRNWHYMTKALVVNTWDLIHNFKVVYCPSNNVKWKKKKFLQEPESICSLVCGFQEKRNDS